MPARTSDDLPVPLAPTTSRNGLVRRSAGGLSPAVADDASGGLASGVCPRAADFSRSVARMMSLERPKKTAACQASNGSRPRNGDPWVAIGQTSDTFDHSGIEADRNLAFPLDRLRELVEAGEIGSAAPRHYSIMASIIARGGLIRDTGPEIARKLHEDAVDAVLLVPV